MLRLRRRREPVSLVQVVTAIHPTARLVHVACRFVPPFDVVVQRLARRRARLRALSENAGGLVG